jgi:hypothetical protein
MINAIKGCFQGRTGQIMLGLLAAGVAAAALWLEGGRLVAAIAGGTLGLAGLLLGLACLVPCLLPLLLLRRKRKATAAGAAPAEANCECGCSSADQPAAQT